MRTNTLFIFTLVLLFGIQNNSIAHNPIESEIYNEYTVEILGDPFRICGGFKIYLSDENCEGYDLKATVDPNTNMANGELDIDVYVVYLSDQISSQKYILPSYVEEKMYLRYDNGNGTYGYSDQIEFFSQTSSNPNQFKSQVSIDTDLIGNINCKGSENMTVELKVTLVTPTVGSDILTDPTIVLNNQFIPYPAQKYCSSGRIFSSDYFYHLCDESAFPKITVTETLKVCVPCGNKSDESAFKSRELSDDTSKLKISPNPFAENIHYEFNSDTENIGKAYILNVNGKIVKNKELSVKKGENAFNLNTHDLPSGVYFFVLESNGHKEIQKIIK